MLQLKILKILPILSSVLLVACASDSSSKVGGMVDDDADYDTDLVGEPSTPMDFHRQCSDAICHFRMFEGERLSYGLSTWHPKDTGIGLVGDEVVISTFDEDAGHPDVPVECYDIRILGAWDDNVEIYFEVFGEYGNFGNTPPGADDTSLGSEVEGTFEYSKRLPRGDWQLYTSEIQTLTHRGQLEFSIRKVGRGDARFYHIEVNGKNVCSNDAIRVD